MLATGVDLEPDRQLPACTRATRASRSRPSSITSPPVDHGDADAERLAAAEAHPLLRRVDIAASHVGDVAQPENAIVGADRDVADRVERVERAGGRMKMRSVAVSNTPAAATAFCAASVCEDLRRLDAQHRQLRVRQLDEDLLFLLADEVDFGDAGHAQQLGADPVAEILQLA